jgi:hypothetical protein
VLQVVWENLEIPRSRRMLRRFAVNALLFSLLVISFVFIIVSQKSAIFVVFQCIAPECVLFRRPTSSKRVSSRASLSSPCAPRSFLQSLLE